MSKYTPGKWFWSERTLQAKSSEIEEKDILEVSANGCIDALRTPDRNLIAAAPELLEALKEAYNYLDNTDPNAPVLEKIEAVLNKAEGRA